MCGLLPRVKGGRGHPDPEIRGGGGLQKSRNYFIMNKKEETVQVEGKMNHDSFSQTSGWLHS